MTGLLTVEGWIERHRRGETIAVVLAGEDITSRCVASDDRQRWAMTYRVRPDGHKYVDFETGRPAMELLIGAIEHRVLEAQ